MNRTLKTTYLVLSAALCNTSITHTSDLEKASEITEKVSTISGTVGNLVKTVGKNLKGKSGGGVMVIGTAAEELGNIARPTSVMLKELDGKVIKLSTDLVSKLAHIDDTKICKNQMYCIAEVLNSIPTILEPLISGLFGDVNSKNEFTPGLIYALTKMPDSLVSAYREKVPGQTNAGLKKLLDTSKQMSTKIAQLSVSSRSALDLLKILAIAFAPELLFAGKPNAAELAKGKEKIELPAASDDELKELKADATEPYDADTLSELDALVE